MALSELPLGYCTNVHPGRTLAEVEAGLDNIAVPVQRAVGRPNAVGLWLAAPVIAEIERDPTLLARLRDRLTKHGLTCYTLNAFPYGDFHSARVKEKVYLPDWSSPERLEYTARCARALSRLLSDATEGSISTMPLAFKAGSRTPDFLARCGDNLLELVRRLTRLRDETGTTIRVAIEPEPFCLLETTDEAVRFFEDLFGRGARSGMEDAARRHLGICYDVCHQAVEFEDAAACVESLHAAGIVIPKVQLSCAIEVQRPGDDVAARQALARYVEPRYLHQTMARAADGSVLRAVDLDASLALDPPEDFAKADLWRVHFHVPVDAETIGPLRTTRPELKRALAAVAGLPYAPHLEIETYTWEVLPGESPDLVRGMAREIAATQSLIDAFRQ
ncbi:MAG: metabolite traffic protein EboE [Planctomycetaceae bacterium]|nr:metabolite traffic protein EboE [Planctomycetaceae bacterium]